MDWIKTVLLARLKEQTTWKGIITLVSALGVTISPEQTVAIATFGVSLVGLVQVLWPEKVVIVTKTEETK